MGKLKKKSNRFYCFSPPVMLATFAIEAGFMVYVLARYKMNAISRLVLAILLFLAIFQLSEYNVCGGMGANAEAWSRVGYVAITALPALGIHTIYKITGKKWNNVISAAYGMALAWAATFAFSSAAFVGHECAGNYAIFQLKPHLGGLYFLHYYAWLFAGIYLSLRFAQKMKKKIRESLILFNVGYLSLLVPTTLANLASPETVSGIPSIMCGFAIILAVILTFGVLPRVGKQKKS